jgi:vancomycin resistance protein VanW
MKRKRLLCQVHPVFYFLSVWEKRLLRHIKWYTEGKIFCRKKGEELPIRVYSHQSLLIRKLGDSDIKLQINKITNLKTAIPRISHVLIRPGETFSLWKLIGNATRKKGYVEGMLLSRGEVRVGVGGGLCQLANLIYWMILHTPLTVVERHHHGFDPFPDNNRVLPYGSGATIFYNYGDLQFTNNTSDTFQLKIWLTNKFIRGEVRCDKELPYSYHVFEREHAFLNIGSKFYRKNQIWRDVIDRQSGNVIGEEFITKNFVEVKYQLDSDILNSCRQYDSIEKYFEEAAASKS